MQHNILQLLAGPSSQTTTGSVQGHENVKGQK